MSLRRLKPAEIARILDRHLSTISRELKRGTVKPVNGKKIYYEEYFAETAQIRYSEGRKGSY
ncbi:MAG: helix-turn-helix domain-containing protein [Streptococcus sp.]|nr:helix-turn-helix domain-containing protein [Streptococcus sp.]RGC41411.1 hypothetical protein DXD73_03965 [Streptococcus gallolyticus]